MKLLTKQKILIKYCCKTDDDKQITYPSEKDGNCYSWAFYPPESYKDRVVYSTRPIYLFGTSTDLGVLVKQ